MVCLRVLLPGSWHCGQPCLVPLPHDIPTMPWASLCASLPHPLLPFWRGWVSGFLVTTHWRLLASLCGLSLVISVLTCLDRESVLGRLYVAPLSHLPGTCVVISAKALLRAPRLWPGANDTSRVLGRDTSPDGSSLWGQSVTLVLASCSCLGLRGVCSHTGNTSLWQLCPAWVGLLF